MTQYTTSPRDALADAFIADFFADWREHGHEAIAAVRADKPADYLRIAVAILPKERNAKPESIDELTDAELFDRLAHLAARAGLEVRARARGEGAAPPRDSRPPRG